MSVLFISILISISISIVILMSRLRWLNSDIGSEKNIIIKPFKKIEVSNNKLRILGREIELNNFGFPKTTQSGSPRIGPT